MKCYLDEDRYYYLSKPLITNTYTTSVFVTFEFKMLLDEDRYYYLSNPLVTNIYNISICHIRI